MITGIFFLLRPADALNFIFLLSLTSITVIFYQKIDSAPALIILYSILILVQAILIIIKDRNSFLKFFYDLIFPTISILAVFDSLEKIVHYINPNDIDPTLIRLDYLIFRGHPTLMLESIMNPVLTDILQITYTSYYFLPLSLGIILKLKKKDKAFDRSLFLIMFCFYLSYIGYLIFPAIGPRYTMHHLQQSDLKGFVFAESIQELLNSLEGIKRDAFPSGHTGIALTVLCLARRYEKRLFLISIPIVTGLIFSTVYCRYHYVVDVIGGIILSLLTVFLGEIIYEYREKRLDTHC